MHRNRHMHPRKYPYSKHHFNRTRIEELAAPKVRSDKFIPDKPSIYWVDYVIDPIPQTLKDPQELSQYYKQLQSNMPRLMNLAKPKIIFEASSRPLTTSGVLKSALTYQPSERIKELAQPKAKPVGEKFPYLPPDRKSSNSSRTRSPASRHPRYPWKKESTDSTKIELGKGDFPTRSKYRIDASSSKVSAADSNYRLKTGPQVHIHNHVNHVTFMQQNMAPTGINNKALKTHTRSASNVGNSGQTDRLQIDRSYAASKVNISIRRVETADNPHTTPKPNVPRFVRPHPVAMKYAPDHMGCGAPIKKKPP